MPGTAETGHLDDSQGLSIDSLFQTFRLGSLELANRIVMAPMTRCMSPNGVPGPEVAEYYRRRAEGGVGLIMTEGTWIPHPVASNDENAPRFYGEDALAGWAAVLEAVHGAGAKIMPQLWHVGQSDKPELANLYEDVKESGQAQVGPSGMTGGQGEMPTLRGEPATSKQIEELIESYGEAAQTAFEMGFDGVELHGAHGYLIDQFFWSVTNLRTDEYGGDAKARGKFAANVVREIRSRTSEKFPIILRFSQWKVQDYDAHIASSPQELEELLAPVVDAGVTGFHCSQRRFWEGEFGTDLNLAGWTKKVTGKPTITVGSVGLDQELFETFANEGCSAASLSSLMLAFERGDFDLVAVGRAIIANPDWAKKVQENRFGDINDYRSDMLQSLA